MSRGLAYRRNQDHKRKNKTLKRALNTFFDAESYEHTRALDELFGREPKERDRHKDAEEWASRNYKNRQRCSCTLCGNPRTHFKEKTLGEKKQESKK